MLSHKTLRETICRILYQEWDPIGIKASGGLADEYDPYAATITRYIRQRRDVNKLKSHLQQLQCESMGLSAVDDNRDQRVAELLHSLAE